MASLKPQLYGVIYKKNERTKLIATFILVLLLFNFWIQIPKLLEQKEDFYKLGLSRELFDNPQYRYQDFLNWTFNLDEIVEKKNIIQSNTLQSKDPNNYLYIEKYISSKLSEIWLPPFTFNNVYNFRNSWRNSIILDITLADKEKLLTFISAVSENWFLWKNINIAKEGSIYKADIELVFEIK